MTVNDLSELWAKVRKAKIGMFTTVNDLGRLGSRPMTSLEVDDDGMLWFFTSLDAPIAVDLQHQSRANISFAEAADSFYVSLSGHAELIQDRERYEKLWNPLFKAWFTRGLDDPQLVLIRFTAESGEYWDSDVGRMAQWLRIAKAAFSHNADKPVEAGTHRNFQL